MPTVTKKGSRVSDVVAFYIICFICILYISFFGIIGWFEIPIVYNNVNIAFDAYPETIFSQSTFIENYLIYPMLVFQGWNLLLCFILNELNQVAMIIHHFIVVLSCQGSLQLKFMQYYAIYLYGILELTNIFLTLMDVFKLFPKLISNFPEIYQMIRTCFVASFVIIRLIGLPYYIYFFARDTLHLLTYPESRSNSISDRYLWFILLSTVFMVLLQFYWGYLIAYSLLRHERRTNEKMKNS